MWRGGEKIPPGAEIMVHNDGGPWIRGVLGRPLKLNRHYAQHASGNPSEDPRSVSATFPSFVLQVCSIVAEYKWEMAFSMEFPFGIIKPPVVFS